MITAAKGTQRELVDYKLSRYACYLIVQNGDPRKEVIALGQAYFAIQTYRQEVADRFNELDEDSRRLVVRGDIKQWNQLLAETARSAGFITQEEFAIFTTPDTWACTADWTFRTFINARGMRSAKRYSTTWAAPN